MASIQLQTLTQNAAEQFLGVRGDDYEDNEPVSPLKSVSVSDRLRSALIVRHMLDLEDGVDAAVGSVLIRLHRGLHCTHYASATQTRTTQYFQ